jgi:CRP-like cAMP-binding protein
LPREIASDELGRLLAITRLVGHSTFDRATLAQLANASRRVTYSPGEALGEEQAHGTLCLCIAGDLRLERADRIWPVRHHLLELLWLARDARPLRLSTPTGAEVLEIPYGALEEAIDEHFASWIEIARHLATQLLSLPAGSRKVQALGAVTLSRRLSSLRVAMPFASDYVDALMQLDREATVVKLTPEVALWLPGARVEHIYLPLDGELVIEEDDTITGVGAIELIGAMPRSKVQTWRDGWSALRVTRELFLDVLEDHPALARDLLAALAKEALRRLEVAETVAAI